MNVCGGHIWMNPRQRLQRSLTVAGSRLLHNKERTNLKDRGGRKELKVLQAVTAAEVIKRQLE